MEVNEEEEIEHETQNIETKYPLLPFEKQIFIDMFEKDALLIMAKGLNYTSILSNLLWVFKDPGNLVLVINSGEYEEKLLTEKFNLTALPALGTEREKAYLEGGIYFVSTRILVVDLLKDRVPISHITGIIVLRAHTVLESCQEAFALRLYRQKNKTGFIKAFSNSPISFTFGYHQVEKVMRALFVTELFLWPRFHGAIIKSLKSRKAEVVELHVPMTTNMTFIQTCLLDIMNYTVKQLKSMNRTLDMQEITTENCMTKKFHKILQSQLDCVWHQLSTRTKEYIQDLKVLRSMIINLIHDDSVSFYALVSKYRSPEYAKINSGWILLDSAEQLFTLAKNRVFNSKNAFEPEPCPKWKCLSDLLLDEIPKEVRTTQNSSLNKTKILILCQDNKTCSQLNHYLTMGANKYLFYTAFRRDITINKLSSKFTGFKNQLPTDKVVKKEKTKNSKQNDNKNVQKEDIDTKSELEDDDEFNVDESNKSNYVLTLTQVASQAHTSKDTNESMFEPISQLDNLDITQIEAEKPLIYIQTFKENGNHLSLEKTLETLRPEYIIMYHSDISAVRQIEIFECKKKAEEPVAKVYFMIHDKTVEEQAYLTALKREKQSFELLIQTKCVMVVPSYQDGKTDEYFNMNVEEEDDSKDTRKAGGQTQIKEKPVVIVDMREFRSDLPSLLHKKGINIEPVTITIGDYILTPDICVERKSISDLIGSLNSGRLYTQCTQMCRNYSRPVLLIEFDQNKSFNLQGHFVVSTDISGADIQQKLQLLTIHFPRLKLVWSPSPYATAELFYELKQGRKNPNVAEALALSGENTADDMNYERYNVMVHDFVQKLPGVTSKNITRIMNKGVSLDHLITLTLEQLTEIIENKNEAESLYSILHVEAKPADVTGKDDKPYGKRKFAGKLFKSIK
ncbi:DNA repair endonuclease XPF [Pectinophora gossypiella]|uniref:DNA repair endonuclease XPF n=1 Tax=Pectinophora gossypiella TaxID=13191 RepID=UPI00214EA217|nr:DNA repair endonuclease XPF [Pectinophora gossypiella]XP_049868552.1 DNA repair endonuclease XPF [Pectinophora gossypiella]XP_049868553.1 DNA repair endonuclease XPF [Pectinophora gossypiella]